MGSPGQLLFLLLSFAAVQFSSCITYGRDAAALLSLMDQMKNTPPNWGQSKDPCGAPWDGVTCNNDSRVTALKLYSMGVEGTLSSDIGSLTELITLDLSYNNKLGGPLTPAIGELKKLTDLFLIGCSFSGTVPNELGNLAQLVYLALNSNQFIGQIPSSLGNLFNLFWLDLADNQLTGSLPVSTNTTRGLDQLVKARHFHLNQNKLTGPIPEKLFSSKMALVHILLDSNRLTGSIPASVGLVQNLTIIRLDNNALNGSVPSSINNLTRLSVLNLANNMLIGPLPNLTGMNVLNSVDLSTNMLVQVLDDSDDPTLQMRIKDEVEKWKQPRVQIVYRHRVVRDGYKAGNLKSAMNCNYIKDYEFVAIFDTNFQLVPDFLKMTVPHFEDNEELGLVQARLSFVNKDENLLTRLQNINLCFHFDVEQQVNGVFINFFGFNGTGRVWRIKALEDFWRMAGEDCGGGHGHCSPSPSQRMEIYLSR